MFLINWIDKQIDEIKGDSIFRKYFNEISLEQTEDRYFLSNAEAGLNLVLSNNLSVRSIHLFSRDSNEEYTGAIPYDLSFSMSRDTIHQLLGTPSKSGGGYTDIYGKVPNWDKYYFDSYSLHLQYVDDLSMIDLITLGSLALESYFNIGLQ